MKNEPTPEESSQEGHRQAPVRRGVSRQPREGEAPAEPFCLLPKMARQESRLFHLQPPSMPRILIQFDTDAVAERV